MKCATLAESEFVRSERELSGRQMYAPAASSSSTVRLILDGVQSPGSRRFFIYSNQAQASLYQGVYRRDVVIGVDARLESDGGWDRLEFWLLDPEARSICYWANERGEPYWRAGATIKIKLLERRRFDSRGMMEMHEVELLP